MNYVYPKLSEKDLGFVRLGGAGLGNILFSYARALVFARDHGCRLIWPTWFSFKFGPILRREMDKRFYHDLFVNRCGAVDGAEKMWLLATKKKVPETEKKRVGQLRETVIVFEGLEGCFDEIRDDSPFVYENLKRNLKKKNRDALAFDFRDSIGVHIRLGDFARVPEEQVRAGRHDSAIPVIWYADMIRQIRALTGRELKVWVFSDGTEEELKPVLSLPRTRRITFGTSIADIMALSRVPLLIASGSSFSMWARYLGRMNCICYPNQMKQKILTERDTAFEYETDGVICGEIGAQICRSFAQSAPGRRARRPHADSI